MKARKESLEEVLAHRSYTTESVKRLFAALEKGKAQDLRPQGVLADFVEVDPQFEKPAEEFLHDELEYVVVENWAQADRGLDFLRAELDGRATFLVHPEKNGNGNGHLPEPPIGPETGILSRLSDSLRLTNGLTDRAATLLPRVSLCFVAEDRAVRPAPGHQLSAPLFPDHRRALLSRPHRHRRQEDRQRSAGHEARSARTGRRAGGPSRRRWTSRSPAWRIWTARSASWPPNWSACAACSRPAKKTASRWITKCANWPTIPIAPTRASPSRAWNSTA